LAAIDALAAASRSTLLPYWSFLFAAIAAAKAAASETSRNSARNCIRLLASTATPPATITALNPNAVTTAKLPALLRKNDLNLTIIVPPTDLFNPISERFLWVLAKNVKC